MKNGLSVLILAGLIGISQSAWAAGDASAGKAKAATCAGCHGADGNSANPAWPKLASQHPGYVAKQLGDFKSKKRDNATMFGMVAALSEQDMQDLGAYFSSLPIKSGTASPDKIALGEKIYRGGNMESGVTACAGCHSPTGAGNPAAGFPKLGGQHAAYTATQLKAFKTGARANDSASMMRDIAKRMSDAEISAVASYIQGLH